MKIEWEEMSSTRWSTLRSYFTNRMSSLEQYAGRKIYEYRRDLFPLDR